MCLCVICKWTEQLTAYIYKVCVFESRNYRKRSYELIRKLSKSMGGFWEKGDGTK